jgi:hypothetical protein
VFSRALRKKWDTTGGFMYEKTFLSTKGRALELLAGLFFLRDAGHRVNQQLRYPA